MNNTQLVKDLEKVSVKILFYSQKKCGSGTLYCHKGHHCVLTAAHCLPDLPEQEIIEQAVILAFIDGNKEIINPISLTKSTDEDCAVIWVQQPKFTLPYVKIGEAIRDQLYTLSGFAGKDWTYHTRSLYCSSENDFQATHGDVSTDNNPDNIWKGTSGGGVFDSNAEILTLAAFMDEYGDNCADGNYFKCKRAESFKPLLESGIKRFDDTEKEPESFVVNTSKDSYKTDIIDDGDLKILLENKLEEAMTSYMGYKTKWVDRFVSPSRIERAKSFKKIPLLSESELIERNSSYIILAPHQHGLTCFGYHFLLTLLTNYHQYGVLVDCKHLPKHKVLASVRNSVESNKKPASSLKWLVLDSWSYSRKQQSDILRSVKNEYPNVNLLLLTGENEKYFVDTEQIEPILSDIEQLYLVPLKHSQMREMVTTFNRIDLLDEMEKVLKRMDDNILNFNMHRTPFSCMTLLVVYTHFNDPIINRTEVMEHALHVLFDLDTLPTYLSEKPDMKDCEYVLGYFCAEMIKPQRDEDGSFPKLDDVDMDFLFPRDFFTTTLKKFCKEEGVDIDIDQLFDILAGNGIIIKNDNINYRFRFSVWVYYFASTRLSRDPELYEYIMHNSNYLHFPDILEFYAGKDRSKEDAVELVANDLKLVNNSINKRIGLADDVNLFDSMRFKRSPETDQKMLDTLNSTLEQSNLPSSMKDSIADQDYNPARAYNQSIYHIWEEYTINHLYSLIGVASKVFRNSYYVSKSKRNELLNSITDSWKLFSHLFFLGAPVLARDNKISFDGVDFYLDEKFNSYQPEEKILAVIIFTPFNIIRFFEENLYSVRTAGLIADNFKAESDKLKKYLLALLVLKEKPQGWFETLKQYIGTIGQNTYYLNNFTNLLMESYVTEDVDSSMRSQLRQLSRIAIFKGNFGRLPGSTEELNKKIKQLPSINEDIKESEDEKFGT